MITSLKCAKRAEAVVKCTELHHVVTSTDTKAMQCNATLCSIFFKVYIIILKLLWMERVNIQMLIIHQINALQSHCVKI